MMEIRFRAWDKHNNRYLKGTREPANDNLFIEEIFEDGSGVYEITHWGDMVLEQYTGLKDKNGVDIYESDIVVIDWRGKSKQIVEFESGMFKAGGLSLCTFTPKDTEVIGNIHQTKEE